MSSYFVAQIKINNNEEYEKYIKAANMVFSKYKGEYLAVDNDPEILEGKWNYSRIVLIKFSNNEELKKWYNSKDYQKILKYRLSAAHCDTIIVNSKN